MLAKIKQRSTELLRRYPIFSRRGEGSLVANVLVLHLFWGVFVYLMAVGGLWWTSTAIMESNFEEQAKRWVRTLDEMGTPLYVSNDSQQFNRIKNQIQGFSELGYVRYYDAEGRAVLGEYQRESNEKPIPLIDLKASERMNLTHDSGKQIVKVDYSTYGQHDVLRAIAPVWVRSIQSDGLLEFDLDNEITESAKLIGFIDLGLDYSAHKHNLLQNILWGSLVIALVFAAVLVLGRYYLLRTFRPLEDLQGPLARLAKGDLRVKVRSGGVREVNAISDALNSTITAIRQRDRELREMANHDSLTKLVNRRYFTDQVISELLTIDEAQRSSAILFIDLDEFKAINDNLGHDAGDQLLIQVADILKNRVRDYDVVSRFGGDEFVILAIGASEDQAKKIAESILELMRSYSYKDEDKQFGVYCSIGITLIENSQFTVDQLIKQADQACHKAKAKGRNDYLFYEANENARDQLLEDAGWSTRLRNALKNNHFVVHYQPIVAAEDRGEEIYEVLLRLKGEGEELISPQAFMGAAERFGIACDISHWVIDTALEQLSVFRSTGRDMALSINIPGCALENDEFSSYVSAKLAELDLSAHHVIFEVQESFLLSCPEKILRNVATLRGIDCRIAIDGFGTGLNASGRLKSIHFDYLKISRDLMQGLCDSKVNQVLVKAIIDLARVMDKKVVAGFVQDEATLKILSDLHVDFVQGYYFAEPTDMPVDMKKLH